jgi:hypothetical protein
VGGGERWSGGGGVERHRGRTQGAG